MLITPFKKKAEKSTDRVMGKIAVKKTVINRNCQRLRGMQKLISPKSAEEMRNKLVFIGA
ncbi:hypothetical protein [Oscillatoria salina]|nr:hypothetical protein [Oscillatoria salina]